MEPLLRSRCLRNLPEVMTVQHYSELVFLQWTVLLLVGPDINMPDPKSNLIFTEVIYRIFTMIPLELGHPQQGRKVGLSVEMSRGVGHDVLYRLTHKMHLVEVGI